MKANLLCVLPIVALMMTGCSDAAQETGQSGGSGGSGSSMAGQAATSGSPTTAGATSTAGSSSGGSAGSTSSGGQAGSAGAAMGGSTTTIGGSAGSSSGGAGGSAPLDGKGLYDASCKACHGEQGIGGLLAPDIMHPVRDYSTWVVRNGRAQTTFPKPMEKWSADQLSDAQLMLIYDYLDQPPQPTTGKALYLDYCANCHGADGKGGPTSRSLLNEVDKVVSQTRSGKNVGKFAMRRDYMPAFPATDITDAELMLIRDYVDSL
jgi:mono/diheme cytochrome c family protein